MSEEIKQEQIFGAINQIANQNFLSVEETKEIIEEAVKKAFHSKYDPDAELILEMDEKNKTFKLFNKNTLVVSDNEYNPEYRAIEIGISDAKKINKDVKVGEYIELEVDFKLYSRQIKQQIRQLFMQAVREKKKEAVYAKHKGLKGEMIEATVTSVSNNHVVLILPDGTTAFMPGKLRNQNIPLAVGERTQVYVEDVLEDSKDSQIIVSNGSKDVVKRVLEEEVPEIQSGIVEIINISRIPGVRSKVAVKSNQNNIDPVGAIIGSKGVRINSIISKLEGEKLDIVLHSEDENKYIAAALSPATIVSIEDKKNDAGEIMEKHKIAIAPNSQQTLAIGKRGINVRLAVELVNHRIDVISIEQAKEKGINISYNVGINEEDVPRIEAGEKINQFNRGANKNRNVDVTSLDNDIDMFNSQIQEIASDNDAEDINNFEIDESLFTDEEIKQMETDFGFDADSDTPDYNNDDEFDEGFDEDFKKDKKSK